MGRKSIKSIAALQFAYVIIRSLFQEAHGNRSKTENVLWYRRYVTALDYVRNSQQRVWRIVRFCSAVLRLVKAARI